jgi:hypothetical protein
LAGAQGLKGGMAQKLGLFTRRKRASSSNEFNTHEDLTANDVGQWFTSRTPVRHGAGGLLDIGGPELCRCCGIDNSAGLSRGLSNTRLRQQGHQLVG